MKSMSGKELSRILKNAGWNLVRVHGSHHIFMKEGRRERLSVPVHSNRPLKKGLLAAILKLAGIEE
ncbi:MAG: type II toxin-antitoxin system HicA family toxin [bacterium]